MFSFVPFMAAFCKKGCAAKDAGRNLEDQDNGETVNEGL